jgi:uncharacterized protein
MFRKGANFTSAMAFQFASTNLVLKLGILLAVLMGWQFALPGSTQACPARIGLIHGLLGDVDLAFEWLEQAIRYREPTILWMKNQPRMTCLGQDRRFPAVLN